MPKRHDLQLLEAFGTRAQQHELQRATKREVAERPEQTQLLQGSAGRATDSTGEPQTPDPRTELTHPTGYPQRRQRSLRTSLRSAWNGGIANTTQRWLGSSNILRTLTANRSTLSPIRSSSGSNGKLVSPQV